ncbi:MAG: HAD family hydrolase [Candidatus Dormibacteraceae bacterium]
MEAVVFDLDGVLIDSEPIWTKVRKDFVSREGGVWHPDTQRRMVGMSTAEWSLYMSTELRVPLPPSEIGFRVVDAMSVLYGERPALVEGAADAVRAVATRWPLALASSSPRLLIDRVLKGSGLAGLIPISVSSEEVARGKPAPDVYLRAADCLGVSLAACVAIEDSQNGVRSALAANMRVIAIQDSDFPLDPNLLDRVSASLTSIRDLTVAIVEAL